MKKLLHLKIFLLLIIIVFAADKSIFAEIINCDIGNPKQGKWVYVDPNDLGKIYCKLPMDDPISDNNTITADGYRANVFWAYTIGCSKSGPCANGNFIGVGGSNLKKLQDTCQDMYYASYQKKYENGCCYVRKHATYGDWIPMYGLYQYGIHLMKWQCNSPKQNPMVNTHNYGPSQTCDQ